MPRSEDRQVQGGGPRRQDSHTPVAADETTDPDRLRLVGTATLGLPERLAGRLDGHLAQFVEHIICNVSDVIDRSLPDLFQPLRQPWRRGRNPDPAHQSGRIARTKIRIANFD